MTPESTINLGITAFQWLLSDCDVLVAATDGERNVLVRQQNNKKLSSTILYSFKHPDIIDGQNAHVFQESVDANGVHHWSTFDTVLASSVPDSTQANVDILAINDNANLLCTKIFAHPKVVWIWHRSTSELPTILIFSDTVKQAVVHSCISGMLVILTAQSLKSGSEPIYRLYICLAGCAPIDVQIPVSEHPQSFQIGRVEGHYLANGLQKASGDQNGDHQEMKPQPFLLTWPHHFEVGVIHHNEHSQPFWRSLAEATAPSRSPHLMQADETDSLLFDTPSKPPRHMKATK